MQAWAKDGDIGQAEYRSACASCHGNDGKGKGPVANQLKSPPSDLTLLAKKNGGVFPINAVYEIVDGRKEIPGHGSRDMPVWGFRFMSSFPLQGSKLPDVACGDLSPSEVLIRSHILPIIDYLYRLQDK